MKSNTILSPTTEMLHETATVLLHTNSKLFPVVCPSMPETATKQHNGNKNHRYEDNLTLQTIATQSLQPKTAEIGEQKSEIHDKNGNKSYQEYVKT